MVNRGHRSDYDGPATERCERALVTLMGDISPWSDRISPHEPAYSGLRRQRSKVGVTKLLMISYLFVGAFTVIVRLGAGYQ